MKKIIAALLLVCMTITLLAGCGDGQIDAEKAQKIVLEDLGVKADQVTMHTHITTYENQACYSIYVTIGDETLEYIINSETGEILVIQESAHSH